MKIPSSLASTFSKQDTVKARRHLMALDPSHKLHVDAISAKITFYQFNRVEELILTEFSHNTTGILESWQ